MIPGRCEGKDLERTTAYTAPMHELPPHTLRRSARARYLRIKVCPREGVVIVVPRGVSDVQALGFLAQKRDWVMQSLDRMRDRSRAMAAERDRLPERIALPAIGWEWTLDYRATAGSVRVRENDETLSLTGALEDRSAVRAALRRWLLRQGRRHLPEWLEKVSAETGLDYRDVKVRAQRTLWGSCNHRHSISLNCKLLCLPRHLVRYVMVHELAHTRHLNHSPRFWSLVAMHEPAHGERERELRTLGRQMPAWADG